MNKTFPRGETVVLHLKVPAGRDDWGIEQYTETDVPGVRAAIWPESATEVLQPHQDRTNVVYLCALDYDHNVDAIDSLTWRGKRYDVQGETQNFNSPFTGTQLKLFRLNRVEG